MNLDTYRTLLALHLIVDGEEGLGLIGCQSCLTRQCLFHALLELLRIEAGPA